MTGLVQYDPFWRLRMAALNFKTYARDSMVTSRVGDNIGDVICAIYSWKYKLTLTYQNAAAWLSSPTSKLLSREDKNVDNR